MHERAVPIALLLALLPAACRAPSNPTVDHAAIRAVHMEMVTALNARDLDRYMSHLAEDATWLPPNQAAVQGRVAIRKLVSGLFEIPDYTVAHHVRSIEISRDGGLAYMYYDYEFTVADEEGVTVTETGKDLSVFKEVDGTWMLVIDMWNSSDPASGDSQPDPGSFVNGGD